MSRTRTLQLGLLVIVFLVGNWALWPRTPKPDFAPGISTAALEAQYGIKLTRIAVTAAGGLVELRFTVLDADKAKLLLRDAKATPTLVADSGDTLFAAQQSSWRNVRVQKGAACFVIFPNARSAVKPGSKVALAFGPVRVEPVVAL
jgi:hypothetical protein